MNIERLNLSTNSIAEQIVQIRSYLNRLAEQLELELSSVDENNFSSTLLERLSSIEDSVANISKEMYERQQQTVVYIDKKIATLNET